MSSTNLPVNIFKLATVRAPRKPLHSEDSERRIQYTFNSSFYTQLASDRASADPRNAMTTTSETFQDSDPAYIRSLDELNGLYPGFDKVDDYLRVHRKQATKAALKSLIEGPSVLGETAATYVADPSYVSRKSQLWDNVFTLSILGTTTALRTEEIRHLRLLNLIEKVALDDAVLNTGVGIFSAYMSTVLLPSTIFPLPKLPLPVEPETRPTEIDTTPALTAELERKVRAYDDIKRAYKQQTYEYRSLQYDPRDEEDPNDELQPNPIKHDPLALRSEAHDDLESDTKAELSKLGIKKDFMYMPHVHDLFGSAIRRLGRLVHAQRDRRMVIRTGGTLIMLGNECVNATTESPCAPFDHEEWPGGAGLVRPIGIADLKVVRSHLYKYELGEVAHVENVLQGEMRKRTFRDLRRQESTLMEQQETYRESEQETQTTERFELQQESSNVIQQDQATQAGVTISGGYGPVSGSASYDTASSTSQAEASSMATNYAKEVMERALQRVIEKTRTRRTVTTIVESEDTTEHVVNNTSSGTGGTDHVVGVYRWLDKVYYNKVVNYGRRMMFEFIVPEPAAFHLFAKLAKPMSNEVIEMPPPFEINSFESIDPSNYDEYAVRYGASNVKPPPQNLISVQATTSHDPTGAEYDEWTTWATHLSVPQGYVALSARGSILLSGGSGRYVTLSIGSSAPITRHESSVLDVLTLPQLTGEIPITMRCKSTHHALSVQVFCEPSAEAIQQWQIDTYAALRTAYEQRVSEYNRWLNQQQVNGLITGTNPTENRHLERTELKKHCIEFISGQRLESFDALRNNVAPFGYPEFSFDEATKEGKYIQFFEQGFEWEQMTYLFYPYYWARKKEWVNILHRNENDPLFAKFLQAGAARVLVPVRPGYEKAILHYLNTSGEIWNGDDVPTPDDPMYVSIIDEIMEADGNFQGGTVEGEPWLSKVPTSLVYLTHGGTPNDLPDYSGDLPL